MSISGSIVIYPARAPATATPAARRKLADAIVAAMKASGVLLADALPTLSHDPAATLATAQVVSGDGAKPRKVSWLHYPIEPELLRPGIGELVYAATAKEFWNENDRRKRDLVAIPYVDLCVFSKPYTFRDHSGKAVCETSALLEFSYADARLSGEIHRVRDPKHPFLRELSEVLAGPVKWGVVSG